MSPRYIACHNKRAGNCHGCFSPVAHGHGWAVRLSPAVPWSLFCQGCYVERVLRQGVLI